MAQKKTTSNKADVSVIRGIYNQALIDIDRIKKERDKKIKQLLKKIDQKQIENVLKDIKNTK